MPNGRLEAQIYFSANVTVSATNSIGGPSMCTITAGYYYPQELVTAFQTALNAGRPSGWTVTKSWGESGTGYVSIACSNTPWSISWTSTDLRDILGYAGNITAVSTTQTATTQTLGVWLAGACPYFTPRAIGDAGRYETDARTAEGPTGVIKGLYGNKLQALTGLRWSHVTKARTLEATGAATSFEYWWRVTQLGEVKTYFPAFSKVILVWNADTDGTYSQYRMAAIDTFDPQQSTAGYDGQFVVEIPRLVVTT